MIQNYQMACNALYPIHMKTCTSVFDGALLNIDEPTMPEIMSSKSSSVPQTIATTPPKGSLTTGSITTTPEGSLTTLSCQDNTLTTQESSTSKSTMVSPQKGTTDRATHLPEIDATSEVPGKSTDKGNIMFYKVKMFNTLCSLYTEVCV